MSPPSVDRAPSRNRSAYLAMMPQLELQGFLWIPVDDALSQATDHVFASADEFFAHPPKEKLCYASPAWVEGYRELGPEYAQVPERPDLTESFSTGTATECGPRLKPGANAARCTVRFTRRPAC
jgi:isopenicillin N synthase-like dioxygenase